MTLTGLDTTSPTLLRTSLLALLFSQIYNPLWPTSSRYLFFPTDYLYNSGACLQRFLGICTKYAPAACTGGPAGTLPQFDFIIAGAGPAGSMLAYRLGLQYPNRLILLIETGIIPPIDVLPPTYFPFDMKISSAYSYSADPKYLTIVDGSGNTCSRTSGVDSNYGLGYNNGLPQDAGKALGGGTVMNAMLWVCGTSQDYEGWKNYTGNNGWGWGTGTTNDGMWWYTKKPVNQKDTSIPQCSNYYSTVGPLIINDQKSTDSAIPLLQAAATQLGYPILPDINCGKSIGLANVHQTIDYGERNHAARALLAPLYNRINVMVMRGATVDKVLLSGNLGGTVTATGLRVVTGDQNCSSFNVLAKNEIILTAGALNSPLILQRSGVGRKCDLDPYSITQRVDSPVGGNLHNHPMDVLFFTLEPTQAEIAAAVDQIPFMASEAETYYWNRNGSISYVGSINWNFFINTNDNPINPNSNPNIQYICYQFGLKQYEFDTILKTKFGIKNEYADQLLTINQSKKLLMCYNVLLNPKSRGLVRIRSTTPTDAPLIYTNYVTDPQDVATANAGINKLLEIIGTTAFQNVQAAHFKINITDCDSLPYPSDAYWNCYRRYFGQDLWHPAGTCKMGKTTDASAVVDPTLQVKGISGTVKVRVADASIMPQITSGNTQCPVYAVAEKLFDTLKGLYA